jgi:hypothetical protein
MMPVSSRIAAIVTGLLVTSSHALADAAACFDDIEQHYEEDDGGFHWRAMPDRCPGSEQPAAPADRKWGSSVDILASGQDARVIETSYSWGPKRNASDGECPRFVKHTSQRTRIAKGGILYETKTSDDFPPTHGERPMRPHENIYIANLQSVVKVSPSIESLGEDTIAGYPCRRLAPKQIVSGAASSDMCFYVVPIDCPHAPYLLPLELTNKTPDGQILSHGRTTLLRVGAHGAVVPPDAIKAP